MSHYPIRVAHIINSLEYGGAEKVLVNIVNNEDTTQYQPYVYSLNSCNPLKDELKNHVVFKYYEKSKIFNFILVLYLFNDFRKNSIKVVHIHGWGVFPESYCASLLARIPVVVLMDHGRVNIDGTLDDKKSLYITIKNKFVKLFARNISAIISVSSDIKNLIIKEHKAAADKIHIIYNGIPDKKSLTDKQATFIKEFKKNNCFILASVGRLAKIKNYEKLVQAIPPVVAKYPGFKLLILGDGPERNAIESQIKCLNLSDHVVLCGFVPYARDYLIDCDAFILPSYYEGISIAILEAMATGLPILASKVGGNIELIKHNYNGLLFEPGDISDITNSIINVIEDPVSKTKYGVNNYDLFTRSFRLDIALSKYHALYESFLVNKP
jgi:L-malate glycosyltransferase